MYIVKVDNYLWNAVLFFQYIPENMIIYFLFFRYLGYNRISFIPNLSNLTSLELL